MTYSIYYFGKITEHTNCNYERLNCELSTVKGMKEELLKKYPTLRNETFKIAVNKNFIDEEILIANDSEIAVLPPFAGG